MRLFVVHLVPLHECEVHTLALVDAKTDLREHQRIEHNLLVEILQQHLFGFVAAYRLLPRFFPVGDVLARNGLVPFDDAMDKRIIPFCQQLLRDGCTAFFLALCHYNE